MTITVTYDRYMLTVTPPNGPSLSVTATGAARAMVASAGVQGPKGDKGDVGDVGAAGPQGAMGAGVAAGGAIGQALVKTGAGDFTTGWGNMVVDGGAFAGNLNDLGPVIAVTRPTLFRLAAGYTNGVSGNFNIGDHLLVLPFDSGWVQRHISISAALIDYTRRYTSGSWTGWNCVGDVFFGMGLNRDQTSVYSALTTTEITTRNGFHRLSAGASGNPFGATAEALLIRIGGTSFANGIVVAVSQEPVPRMAVVNRSGGVWGAWRMIEGVPAGGTTGQVLRKLSNVDFDDAWGAVDWADLTGRPTATPAQINPLNGSFGVANAVLMRENVNFAEAANSLAFYSAGGASSGITVTRVGSGFEDGQFYVDYTLSGTKTGPNYFINLGNTRIPAAIGQTWTHSVTARVIGGTVPSLEAARAFVFIDGQISPGNTNNNDNATSGNVILTNSDVTQSATRQLITAGTNQINAGLAITGFLTSGLSVDCTIRVKGLQLDQAASRAAYRFLPATPAQARAAICGAELDALTLNGPVATELMSDGSFLNGNTNGWIGSGATLSLVNGRLAITSTTTGTVGALFTAGAPFASGVFRTSFDVELPVGRSGWCHLRNGLAINFSTNQTGLTGIRRSAGTTELISFFWTAAAAGEVMFVDNISVRRTIGSGEYVSADTAITLNGATNFAHGLGVSPTDFEVFLVCATAEAGYAVGDAVRLVDVAARGECLINSDANNVSVRLAAALNILNKTTLASVAMTAANWRLRALAWR